MKKLSLVLTTALVATVVLISSCKKKDNAPAETGTLVAQQSETYVDTMSLKLQNFNKQIVCNGQLRAKAKSELYFASADMVTAINVQDGQRVAKGTIIASTDKREKTRELEKTEHELERARVDFIDKLISLGYNLESFNIDPTTADVPKDVLKRAEVTSGYYTAKFALQAAKTALEECNLRAPFAGRIADLTGKAYQRNEKICTLIDDSHFDVEFKILEAELPNVKTGQHVVISPFIDEATTYEGVVTQINPLVDEKGLVKITARTNGTAKNGIQPIDGMNVRVIVEQEVRKMFVVPKDAVVERDGYHVVFLYRGGRAVWTYVDILHSNINSYAITGCERKETTLHEGDIVITSGNLNLADDTEVTINHIDN